MNHRCRNLARHLTVVLPLALLTSCQDPNALALKVGARPTDGSALKEAQTRSLTAASEAAILSDLTQTMQDLGYGVTESSAELGVMTASKSRDATESGQVAGQVALTILLALGGAAHSPVWDKVQSIRVTSTVQPGTTPGDYAVRVSFDRYIWNNHDLLWKTELIRDPAIYQEFFNKLSQGRTISMAGAK